MKKIAIPTYNNVLSEHFGRCNQYEIFTLENGKLKKSHLNIPEDIHIESIPEWVYDQGITDLITYKIEKKLLTLFAKFKIDLFIGVNIKSPETIIEEYMKGTLKSDKRIIDEIAI